MDSHTRLLINHLAGKGMEVTTIPGSFRNLANTLLANPNLSLAELNSRLRTLGWDKIEVDDETLHLVIEILCSEQDSTRRAHGGN